jgi:PAS domain S-box-containing protein
MKRILIVDDKEENIYYLQALLTGSGFTVNSARHGAEALVKARLAPPDLIVSDLLMPVMDGYTLLRLWKADARLRAIPFIVYTATYTEPEDERLALSLGADAFILKPAEPEDFMARIREVQTNAAARIPTPAKYSTGDEKELLKVYSETLIRKLEEKTLQLEESNRALQRDITERKKAEENLRLLNSAVVQTKESILVTDAQLELPGPKIIFVNPAFTQMTGYTAEEVIGKTPRILQGPRTDKAVLHRLRQNLKNGEVFKGEAINYRKDGTEYIQEWQITPLHDAGGNITHYVAIQRDITERKQAEALLFASQQRLNAFFTNAPAGLVLLDKELRYVQINETVANVNGLPVADHLGKTIRQILPKLAPMAEPLLQKVLATGQPIWNVELSGETPGQPGVLRHWLETFFPTFDKDGRPDGVGVIFVETTGQKQTEMELRESQEKFSRIFESSPMAMALSTLEEGRYLNVNQEFLKMLQRTRDEVIGRTALELGVWSSLKQRNEQIAKLKEQTSVRNVELEIRGKLGQVNQILWSAERVVIGGKDCLLGSLLDISERKQVEVALSQSEEKYRKIFENVQDVFYQTDTAGRIIEISPSIERYSGYRRADLIGKPVEEVYYDRGDREKLLKILREQGEVTDYELCLKTKDEHLVHVSVNAHIMQDAGGNPAGVEGVLRDITERKRAEEELRWKTAFLEAQLDSSMDGILVVDSQGRTIQQNQRLNILWKIPPAIVAAKDDRMQVEFAASQTKNPDQFMAKVAYLYSHPDEVGRDEIELVDGTILDRYSSPVRNKAGDYYGRIWTFRDITEQRKLEAQFRQSQKMEAFGQLAGGVAHDFNNILAVIQLQAGLLKSEATLSLEQIEFARDIEKAAERGANLTRQLLLFSRKQTMQPRNLKVKEVVDNMIKMFQRTLGEQVQIQFKFAEEPLVIHADPGMIDQILLNLVVNARDAMPTGGQIIIETSAAQFDEVTATQLSQARPGLFVCLSVSDTGSGIPPEILPRIFEPFFTTKEVGKGTGLGLATVFGIVQQHQGWINAYSEVGRGSTFRVYLPCQTKTTDTEFFWSSRAPMRGGNETILLVEDEAAVLSSVRIALTRLGYRVLEAANGEQALAVWNQHRDEIRLLLTDLVMPGEMTGKELAGQLLQQNPKLKVIFASGYSVEVAGKDLLLEEGVNFLAKPFQAYKLAQTIRNQLDPSA